MSDFASLFVSDNLFSYQFPQFCRLKVCILIKDCKAALAMGLTFTSGTTSECRRTKACQGSKRLSKTTDLFVGV